MVASKDSSSLGNSPRRPPSPGSLPRSGKMKAASRGPTKRGATQVPRQPLSRRRGPQKEEEVKKEPPARPHTNVMTRDELVEFCWDLLAKKNQTTGLTAQQLRPFGELLDFQGSDKEWLYEFSELCADAGVSDQDGITKSSFQFVVNDPHGTLSCANDDLRSIVKTLEKGFELVKLVSKLTRNELLYGLFCSLFPEGERGGGRMLRKNELMTYFQHRGLLQNYLHRADRFEADDWAEVYTKICTQQQIDPDVGLGMAEFSSKTSESEDPCFLMTKELGEMLGQMKVSVDVFPMGDWERDHFLKRLFLHAKPNNNGRLDMAGLRRFAALLGFEGSAGQWAAEYLAMCSDRGWDERLGVNWDDFTVLMSDRSYKTYKTDAELKDILLELVLSEREPDSCILFMPCLLDAESAEDVAAANHQKR